MITGVKKRFSLVTAGVSLTPAQREAAAVYFDRIEEVPILRFLHPGTMPSADAYLVSCDTDLLGAVEAAGILQDKTPAAVLFLTEELDQNVQICCGNAGIPVFPQEAVLPALTALYCTGFQLKALNRETEKLQNKLDDARLISRAKLLLINRFKMSEKEAHRYIEKAAMDHSLKRRDVAISIIKTYED